MDSEKPLLIPFAILGALLILGFGFVIWNSSNAKYSDHVGTVCCLSEKYYVTHSGKAATEHKMMKVDLDSGRSVEVPILHIPYKAGGRVLVREVKGKLGPHLRIYAVRYLASENT